MSAEKISIGSKTKETVVCDNCKKSIPAGEQYTFKGKDKKEVYLCTSCKENINKAFENETKNPNLPGALLGGVAAGAISGLLWFLFVIVTKREFGLIAIGVGWLIGTGVYLGSGRKRGFHLQLLSVLFTLATLLTANYFVLYRLLQGEIGVGLNKLPLSVVTELFIESVISPIGLLIWAIGLYVAFRVPQARKI